MNTDAWILKNQKLTFLTLKSQMSIILIKINQVLCNSGPVSQLRSKHPWCISSLKIIRNLQFHKNWKKNFFSTYSKHNCKGALFAKAWGNCILTGTSTMFPKEQLISRKSKSPEPDISTISCSSSLRVPVIESKNSTPGITSCKFQGLINQRF